MDRFIRILESLALVALGVLIIYLGGMTRTYSAFGGEDIAGIAVIIYGLIPERRYRHDR